MILQLILYCCFLMAPMGFTYIHKYIYLVVWVYAFVYTLTLFVLSVLCIYLCIYMVAKNEKTLCYLVC